MFGRWLGGLFPKPPRPSAYIDAFLSGELTLAKFASNIGDGWVGSDLEDWSWLKQIHEIEKRYNPDFPRGIGDAWRNPSALEELRALSIEFRATGK
jgi:hypothetical protein